MDKSMQIKSSRDIGSKPVAEKVENRLEEMIKADPKSDAGKASEGGPKEEELPTRTDTSYSFVDNLSSISLLPQPPRKSARVISDLEQEQVNKLLDHVMRGEQVDAETMIIRNPALLNYKGSGKEFHNDREFRSITPFQYALWALDWYMWDMMMGHIDHTEACVQLEDLERNGTEHGKQFRFDNLIRAYKVYYNKFYSWDHDQQSHYWIKEIGRCQRDLPIHALQEYYREDRSMVPTPDFMQGRGIRSGNLKEMVPRLGVDHGTSRCHGGHDPQMPHVYNMDWQYSVYVKPDELGMISLKDTRKMQYKELKNTLLPSKCCDYWTGICGI